MKRHAKQLIRLMRPAVLCLGGAALLLLGLHAIQYIGVAHAAAQAVPDPIGATQVTADATIAGVETYGPVLFAMYFFYAIASRLVAKYAASSWFAEGKRLAYTTGALGVAGAALQAQVGGAPWQVILAAATAAAFKVITPTVTPASARDTQSGRAPVRAVMALALTGAIVAGAGFIAVSCGPKTTAILNAALDCTTEARRDLVAAMTPTATSAINKIADPSTGKITTDALQALFSGASLKSEAGIVVACAEAKAIELIAKLVPIPGRTTVAAAGATLDVVSLHGAFAGQFPGATFQTGPGQ